MGSLDDLLQDRLRTVGRAIHVAAANLAALAVLTGLSPLSWRPRWPLVMAAWAIAIALGASVAREGARRGRSPITGLIAAFTSERVTKNISRAQVLEYLLLAVLVALALPL